MRYDGVIFDFDGTLADTSEGVLASVEYSLEKIGVPVPDRSILRGFIGPALYDSYINIIGLNEEDALKAVEHYREVYVPKNVYRLRLFDGIKEMLTLLKKEGIVLSVASSKPYPQLLKAIGSVGISELFDQIIGPDPSVTTNNKEDYFRRALLTENTVVVGDAIFDIDGAHKAGLPVIAVTYGFGKEEDLIAHNPDYTVSSVQELTKFLTEK